MQFNKINSVGIVGYGAFGAYVEVLAKRFLPDVTVKVYSGRFQPDGQLFFTKEEVCACDVVVLCCAISDYEATLTELLPLLAKETVIIDVATVKNHTSQLLKNLAPNRQYVCTHPMFGPESDKKCHGDTTGFRIVVSDKTISSDNYTVAKSFLQTCGFEVIEMSSDEHDKLLAETLFLTHYIGQTVQTAGFSRTAVDTVSFASLMNAVESVGKDSKLFKDVYDYNPYCKAVAVRFHEAQQAVFENVLKSDKL